MVSMRIKLTQAVVAKALAKRAETTVYRDTEVAGFSLRVGKRSASYFLDYKPVGIRPDGRQNPSQSLKIGTTDSHSPSEARSEAARLKVEVTQGGDPAATKRAEKASRELATARATKMSDAVDEYISFSLHGSTRHVTTEGGGLKLAVQEMGADNTSPSDVTSTDILRMLTLHKGRACAVHRYGALRRFFDDLVSRDIVTANPCDRVPKRHRPKPPAPRTRYYTAFEIQALFMADGLPKSETDFLRTSIYLPLRFGELCELRESDLDRTRSRLVLQGRKTKNGDDFALPIPERVLARLFSDRDGDTGGRVFALSNTDKPFTGWSALTKRIRKASEIDDFNFHDLRRTFMTVMAELGIGDPTVADALLNHRQSATRSGVIAAYNQASLWPQKVRMMEAWASLVDHAVEHGYWTN